MSSHIGRLHNIAMASTNDQKGCGVIADVHRTLALLESQVLPSLTNAFR